LDPPRDGDQDAGEGATLAQVIPLRRRTPEGAQPPHSGVFDPPPEPEPLSEYSVWERPTAELIRREDADELELVATGTRAWPSALLEHRGGIASIGAALLASAALAVALSGPHRTPRHTASSGARSFTAGLGAPLSATPPSAPRKETRRTHVSTGTHRHKSASSEISATPSPAPEATASSPPPEQSASYASTPPKESEPSRHTAVQASAASAEREFGFER
jgi:hypothetical protein